MFTLECLHRNTSNEALKGSFTHTTKTVPRVFKVKFMWDAIEQHVLDTNPEKPLS
jgi:hypothetical protein